MSSDNSTPKLTFSALTPEEKIYILKYRALSEEDKQKIYEKSIYQSPQTRHSKQKCRQKSLKRI